MGLLNASYGPAPTPGRFVNGILFNVAWLAIVLSHSSLLAVAITAAYLSTHFLFIGKGRAELQLIVVVTLCGAFVDQLLFRTGVFNLAGQPALAPLWLTCLWPVFASTLMHSFAALQNRLVLAAVVGALGGTLSYTAGVRLTPVDFGSPLWSPIILGALWAAVFPAVLRFAARLSDPDDALQSWVPEARRALD
jgi:hypothetical protein